MTKKRPPKNVIKLRIPPETVPADLPSVEWLKELQDTLKKQTEAAVALVQMTSEAAQRIHRYAQDVRIQAALFDVEEMRSGWVKYSTAIKLISDEPVAKRARLNIAWLGKKHTERINREQEEKGSEERYDITDFEEMIYPCMYDPHAPSECMHIRTVVWLRELFQEYSKKNFALNDRRFVRSKLKKRGPKKTKRAPSTKKRVAASDSQA
jgi:hypothetical protein